MSCSNPYQTSRQFTTVVRCCFTVLFFITNGFSLVCSIFSCCLYLSLQGVLNEIFNSGVCTGLLWKAVTVVALARNCTASPPSVITVVSYNVLMYQAWHSEPAEGSNSAIVTTQHLHVVSLHLFSTIPGHWSQDQGQEVIQLISAGVNRFFLSESAQEKLHSAVLSYTSYTS